MANTRDSAGGDGGEPRSVDVERLVPLWEEGEVVLARGVRRGDGAAVLVAFGPVARLEHEFALRHAIEPSWGAQPLELACDGGRRPALVLADPGGEVLARLVGHAWDLTTFLRVAIGLAIALDRGHDRGITHKDLRPANILVDARAGAVWLTGFGIASLSLREQQSVGGLVPAGALAYVAPEQTGRMNRSIDARSDLYSLGVTLYQLLTGALPFSATDPAELLHGHLAREPAPPHELLPGIPRPVSAIVTKLLAKTPEDRYQSARGVLTDLRRCLAEWQSFGRVEPFKLGAQDVSRRLRVPEKLYGRDREIDALLAAFARVVAGGARELVLVTGYPGAGKSSLVNELRRVLLPARALFASGKADESTREVPYAPFAHGLRTVMRGILAQSEAEVGRWRESLQRAVGPNGRLIVDLVPELALVIGEQAAVAELPPEEANNRFYAVFRRFLGVFATAEHPLVLFLDDLQWADEATLDLLEHVVRQDDAKHLFLVGACRDQQVDARHPLARAIARMTAAGATVREIAVPPLQVQDFEKILGGALACSREHVRPLARLVYEKTSGNPFFAIQFVTALYDDALIGFDPVSGRWTWDVTRIQAQNFTDNVVELMLTRFGAMPAATREALKDLACLGRTAPTRTLELVHGEHVHAALAEAIRSGLVFQLDGAYSFLHDRVREASYALLAESERPAAHRRIAQRLLAGTPSERREEAVFDIVNPYNSGASLVVEDDERLLLAELNLLAGRRARASSAYAQALKYLTQASALLPADRWQRCPALAFPIELAVAECEWLSGATGSAEARLSRLASHVTDPIDLAAIVCLQIHLYTTTDRFDRVVPICRAYLRGVGIALPAASTDDEVLAQYQGMRARMGERSIESLLDLPPMTDPRHRAVIDVLSLAATPAYFVDKNLYALLIIHIVLLSLEHGNTDGSALAFSLLPSVIGPRFSAYRDGYRFGRLSADLVDKRGLDRYAARVLMVYAINVIPWTSHLGASHAIIKRARETALESGDPYAAYCAGFAVTYLLAAGTPLAEVQREAERALGVARQAGSAFAMALIGAQLDLIRTLRAPLVGDDAPAADEERLFSDPYDSGALLAVFRSVRELQGCFHRERYDEAVALAALARERLDVAARFYEEAEFHLYSALAHAAVGAVHVERVAAHHAQLALWAEDSPQTFGCQAAMVEAELARLQGRELAAERLYERAIGLARAEGFVQFEAVAGELAARFWERRGFATIAAAYAREAQDLYDRWGARSKVELLARRLRAGRPAVSPVEKLLERLDVAAVLRASQALSSEIVLERLIEALMRMMIESAGATRGALVMLARGEVMVAAVATTGKDGVAVQLRGAAAPAEELPQTVIQYVVRARESVLLDDALQAHPFADDPYIARHRCRSLLCLPLAKQSQLVAVLLLENTLTPHAFTSERIAVLTVLASQAAISLENARLYAEVGRSEGRLTRIVDTIPTLAWSARPDGAATFFNRQWLDYTGLSLAEAQAQRHPSATHPDDTEAARSHWQRLVQAGEPGSFEARLRRADGVYRWFLTRVQPLYDEQGIVEWYGTSTDIEDRKQAEMELDSRVRFWSLRSSISSRLAAAPTDRLDAEIDKALAEVGNFFEVDSIFIFWFSPSGPHAVSTHTWARSGVALPPNTTAVFPESVDEMRRGEDVPVHDVERMPEHKREERLALEAMGIKSVIALPLVVGGVTLASLNLACTSRYQHWTDPIRQRLRILGEVFANALCRRRAELDLERSESALHRAQTDLAHVTRITTLGELAASIAHEINQPLTAIIAEAAACTNWLSAPQPKLDHVRESLAAIAGEGSRAGEILRRIRALLSRSAIETNPCDLTAVVHAVLPVVRRQLLQAEVVLETSLQPNLPVVVGDPVQLQQVVLNLILNANDASRDVEPGRRRITVRTFVEWGDEPSVVVEVEDWGVGIGNTDLANLFQPFFTTKTHGLGMGLAISRSIIERHGGRLWARPNPSNIGATFGFSLTAITCPSQRSS
ncbi:PAS domain S-box-containing protein [Nannocystis exedens]|uniref:histidine kinase n=1 Tax=Nannocystis exedens TaxID=54 RepID=A0A1I1UAT6_9BACT|nr:AAA family ATPase [Nannocystis exedens]PCC71565.1 histidine kinase [Nannocystis exedens]SFD67976.1 PAS domain S-box-containing protein [Nannocystis exedens]